MQHELKEKELKLVDQLHKDLNQRYPAWKERLECSYVPLELIREILPPNMLRP
jgi:hypothetical protein